MRGEGKYLKLNFIIHLKKTKLKILKKKQKYIFIIFIIGITFVSGVSIGKAIYTTNIKNTTEIAKPILEIEKGEEISITENNKQGEYSFTVKNYNQSEEISQVDLKYYIEILENGLEDAIQYQLYKDNEVLVLKENKTEEIIFQRDLKEEQNYVLKVTYDDSKNTIEDMKQDIQIKIHSEQIQI